MQTSKPSKPSKASTDLTQILSNLSMFRDKTKEQAEFVITRFDETLEWTKGIEHLCTVYNKGEVFEPCKASEASEAFEVLQTPNHGCGLESMLRHIITRYHKLADMTMFCQGRIADRQDQPLYPLTWYFTSTETSPIKAYLTDAYDIPTSRYRWRISEKEYALKNRNLQEFREVIGLPYKFMNEIWVRGDWISVSKELICSKPLAYYLFLYKLCQFERGILVEECWFLERSWYSIFTRPLAKSFTYPIYIKDILI
jgi:hypothetical protein